MAGEWARLQLGMVCSKIGSGATPRGGSSVYLEDGPVALIRSQNVYNDGFHHDGLAFIGDRHAEQLSNVEVCDRDVLLNITGDSVARACQVDPAVLPARVNQHVAILRPDPDVLDPAFLRYFLVTPEMQAKLLSWAGSGGTRKALTKGMIESFDVPAPDISQQRAIAHILGTLDDKIELHRRMNQTLEGMARALFKSWFVDFDPVRAKMQGRWQAGETLPGLPAELYDLFPDRLAESELGELGEVPEGWDVRPLADVVSLRRDSVKPQDYPHEVFHHYSIPAFDDGCTPKAEPGEAIKSSKYRVSGNGVLISKLNPRIPRVWLPAVSDHYRSICSTEFLVVEPSEPGMRPWIYSLLSSDKFQSRFGALVTGTSGSHQRVRPDAFLALTVLVPPGGVRGYFGKLVEGLLTRVEQARIASGTLSDLRGTLLPRLISGGLPVPEVEALGERSLAARGGCHHGR